MATCVGGSPSKSIAFARSIFFSVKYCLGGIFICSVNSAFRYPSETPRVAASCLTVVRLNKWLLMCSIARSTNG